MAWLNALENRISQKQNTAAQKLSKVFEKKN